MIHDTPFGIGIYNLLNVTIKRSYTLLKNNSYVTKVTLNNDVY